MEMQTAIEMANLGRDLTAEAMQFLLSQMLQGKIADSDMSALLVALHTKGESVSELVGAAKAMRSQMTPVVTRHAKLLDTCGTGGDGAKTFNISTAAAIVAAAAGVPVAKHGNRKVTSATGSADVLSQLGIKIEVPRECVTECLDKLGIGFCFAPLLHPAMKHVATVRRSIATPTLFNYLGPLCNPASATHQVLGVGSESLHSKIASALSELPIERAIVVRGADGMDEVSLMSETQVIEVTPGRLNRFVWTPDDFGLNSIALSDLIVDGPEQSADMIREILDGKRGGPRDIVVANAAAGIWVAQSQFDLKAASLTCQQAIDSGRAKELLANLVELTNAN